MPLGIIDLGSNSLLLLVVDAEGRVLHDSAQITRLGQGVFERGSLHPAAVQRSRPVVEELARRARQLGAARVIAVGTEALRQARDGAGFLAALQRDGTVDAAHLLSGEQEAALVVEASRRALGKGGARVAVVDVGGGSTELAWALGPHQLGGVSLPLGSVRLTEAFVSAHPIPPRELERLGGAAVRELWAPPLPVELGGAPVVAVAGTATTLAALELGLERYDSAAIEGLELEVAALERRLTDLAQMSVAERLRLPGLEAGRADVIVAGLIVLRCVLERLGASRFRVSGRGVRHGVALHLLDGRNPF